MKALSIKQPWAWAIIHGGKDIENRTWSTKFRGTVLIHSGLKFDDEGGFIVPLKSVVDTPSLHYLHRGGIVGQVEITACVDESDSPWFFGPWGFVLSNAKPMPFFPCRGQLGFFDVTLPASV